MWARRRNVGGSAGVPSACSSLYMKAPIRSSPSRLAGTERHAESIEEGGAEMRTALIAALVAAAVAASGAAAATTLVITSKQIKNRTIRLVDLHPSTVAALRAKPLKLSHSRTTNSIMPGGHLETGPLCPQGTVTAGGGYETESGVDVIWSRPSEDGWVVIARNIDNVTHNLTAWAVCLA
jgi:hypothetical protein